MSGKKILVVEDDPSIRRVIALALKSGGYADVQEVESGDVAVEVAFENSSGEYSKWSGSNT